MPPLLLTRHMNWCRVEEDDWTKKIAQRHKHRRGSKMQWRYENDQRQLLPDDELVQNFSASVQTLSLSVASSTSIDFAYERKCDGRLTLQTPISHYFMYFDYLIIKSEEHQWPGRVAPVRRSGYWRKTRLLFKLIGNKARKESLITLLADPFISFLWACKQNDNELIQILVPVSSQPYVPTRSPIKAELIVRREELLHSIFSIFSRW